MALHRRKNRRCPEDDGIARAADPRGEEGGTTMMADRRPPPPPPDDDDGGGGGASERGAIAETTTSPPPPSREGASVAAKEYGGADASSSSSSSSSSSATRRQSFHVARYVILRLVGFVYLVAFGGAYIQNAGLMGEHGLVPAMRRMEDLRAEFSSSSSPMRGFISHPSLYWFVPPPLLGDMHLLAAAGLGSALSFAVVLGLDSWSIMVALWLLDFTIVTAAGGNSFYAYGWESQLLETGFLSIWLCDPPLSSDLPPSLPVLWLFRWLCARISVGAGLIKLRGGECWRMRTCLYYHFETQPIPSPLSFFFHFLPKKVLRMAVDLDFFVQLYSVWLVLIPGFTRLMINLRRLGGFIQAGFMLNIILSGNFAFLNHVTIIPAMACLDDDSYPRSLKSHVYRRRGIGASSSYDLMAPGRSKMLRLFIDLCLVTLIGALSMPVVANLLQIGGKHQAMNASFDSFRLVNTYGAFGSVGEARYEPIISVSDDGREWTEMELPCKPGNVKRRPCFCAPYHYRLDWNIWFIGFKPHQSMLQHRERWVFELLRKILTSDAIRLGNDKPWLALLDPTSADWLRLNPVKYVKVDMYRYRMADPLWIIGQKWLMGEEVIWWTRDFEEILIHPLQLYNGSLAYANF